MDNKSVISHFGMETFIGQGDRYCCYKLKLEQGHGTATVYPVLPGIEVIFLDIYSKCYTPKPSYRNYILEMNYCRQGRAEFILKDGNLHYSGEGDLTLFTESNHTLAIELPLGYYQGIAVIADLDMLRSWTKKLLPEIPIDLKKLTERLFVDDNCFCIQARDEIQNFFEEMYTVPEEARITYYRLKVQELLLKLHYLDISKEKPKKIFERQQVLIVKKIHKRITEELSRRFTIDELSKEYFISPTALKQNFKGVYGVAISAYMKDIRIKKAADLLQKTNMNITDIAQAVGYKSQSKLGAAFKDVMKETPLEYRKAYRRKGD